MLKDPGAYHSIWLFCQISWVLIANSSHNKTTTDNSLINNISIKTELK